MRSGNKVWSQFRKDISGYGKGKAPEPEREGMAAGSAGEALPYMVSTTCDALNIRSGAGISCPVSGCIREKAGAKKKYTVVEEKNGWGRLKSGAGWISLAYTRRVS